jgi:hypothetical protein
VVNIWHRPSIVTALAVVNTAQITSGTAGGSHNIAGG